MGKRYWVFWESVTPDQPGWLHWLLCPFCRGYLLSRRALRKLWAGAEPGVGGRDTAQRDAEGRCLECRAEIGHYNGCSEDPDPPCICHLSTDDGAYTDEAECPYHNADPATLVYPP